MGVEAPLVSSGLLAIVAQRRLRLNCQYCQEKETFQRDRIREIGMQGQIAVFLEALDCQIKTLLQF